MIEQQTLGLAESGQQGKFIIPPKPSYVSTFLYLSFISNNPNPLENITLPDKDMTFSNSPSVNLTDNILESF
jgi:hypothetical protein